MAARDFLHCADNSTGHVDDVGAREALLRAALDASGVALWHADLTTGNVFLSCSWGPMLGLPAYETLTTLRELHALVHPDDFRSAMDAAIQTMKGRNAHYEVEHRVRCATGEWRWILSRGMVTTRDPRTGRALEMAGTNVDIHGRNEAEKARLESERRLRVITDNIPGVIAYVDSQLVYRFVNKTHESWLGLPNQEVIGREMSQVLPAEVFQGIRPHLEGALRGEVTCCEFALACGNAFRDVQSTYVPDIDAAGVCQGLYVLCTDVSLLKTTQKQLVHLTQHDVLTGLANRRLLEDRLDRAMAMARRKKWTLALLFVDIDRFKDINDDHGHATGDEFLKIMASRLRRCVKESDTVARVGGDEFVVILEDVKGHGMPARVADKVLDAVRSPVQIGSLSVVVTASIGVAVYEEGETADQLLSRADNALYGAKKRGRNRLQLLKQRSK